MRREFVIDLGRNRSEIQFCIAHSSIRASGSGLKDVMRTPVDCGFYAPPHFDVSTKAILHEPQ